MFLMSLPSSAHREIWLLSSLRKKNSPSDPVNTKKKGFSPRNFPSKLKIWVLLISKSTTAILLVLSLTVMKKGLLNCPCSFPFDPNWNKNWYWCGITWTNQGLQVSGCPFTWISTLCCPTHCGVYVTVYLPFLVSFISVCSWSPVGVEMLTSVWSSSLYHCRAANLLLQW